MGIGLSGMISGLDTDAIVEAMVGGQTAKKTKMDNKVTLNKWTTTAWSDLNKKIYSFYTDFASKLRLKSSYQTKTAGSSNETKIKASASSSAAIGQHTIKVQHVPGHSGDPENERCDALAKAEARALQKLQVIA